MRYLVTARVKPERAKALDRAIEDGTLGAGSIAGDEYLHNMSRGARAGRRPREVGRDLFLRDAAGRRAAVLGSLLRAVERQGRARAQPLPARDGRRALGLRELRLYGEARAAAGDRQGARSGPRSRTSVRFSVQSRRRSVRTDGTVFLQSSCPSGAAPAAKRTASAFASARLVSARSHAPRASPAVPRRRGQQRRCRPSAGPGRRRSRCSAAARGPSRASTISAR